MMLDAKLEHEIALLHRRICPGFADPKRVSILYALAKGPLCVKDLAQALGFTQPTTSRHLRVLREHGLVHADRQGALIFYSLVDRRLIEALDLLRDVLASQLAAEADLARMLA